MSKKLKITVTIEDEEGKAIITSESEKEVPYIGEIEDRGFRTAFHELETAVLETRKEAGDKAVSDYLEFMSQKKREMKP
jgi:C4-type Zn-finger protein